MSVSFVRTIMHCWINICRLWDGSTTRHSIYSFHRWFDFKTARYVRWFLQPWNEVFKSIIILIIVFMPILNAWWTLLPVFVLWRLADPSKTNSSHHLLVFFGLVLLVSAIFSPGFKSGMKDLWTHLSWIMMAWLIGSTFSKAFAKKILYFITFSSLLWLGIGLLQQWAGVPTPSSWLGNGQEQFITIRIYSVFGNPNIYGLYLLSILVFAVYGLSDVSSISLKIVLTIILVAVLLSLYLTYSRTAWILGCVFGVCHLWRNLKNRRWVILGGIIPLFFLTGWMARFSSLINLSDSSLGYRLKIWQGVMGVIQDYWLWGYGPGSFSSVYPAYQIGQTVSNHSHQLFLQLWLEFGIFSVIMFLLFVQRICGGNWQENYWAKALVISILLFLGYGLTEAWSVHKFMGGYFWLLAGILLSLKGEVVTE